MKRLQKDISIGKIKIKDVCQRTVGLIGQKGSGKTTAIRVFLRELDKLDIPAVVLDPTGSAKDEDFFNITVPSGIDEEGRALLMAVIEESWKDKAPLVIDVSELRRDEMADLSAVMFEDLRAYRDGVVMVDEIPDFTPQFGKFKSEELIRFNRKCRNNNVGFVFATQRPQSVDKDVLALADILLVMRVVWPSDQEAIERTFKRKYDKATVDTMVSKIAHFGPGEVYVIDFR